MNERAQTLLKIVAPVMVLAIAGFGALALANMSSPPETRRVEAAAPVVRVETVRLETTTLTIESQGTVQPRTVSQVVPEVPGRVVWVSQAFVEGGFFEPGQALLRLEAGDYEQAIVRARAEIAAARLRLAQEEAEARLARREWEALGEGEASELTLRIPQLENAAASVAAAEADLARAERDLQRTEIQAPYAGRVMAKSVDIGQYVNPGAPLGTVYAIDRAEVRLPLPDDDLAFLDLPFAYRGGATESGPAVTLFADFGGRAHTWEGRIVRTEGVVDPETRMIPVIASIRNPYARGADPDRPPLTVGMFVRAEIEGIEASGVARLPRSVLTADGTIPVLDRDDRLRMRPVTVLRTTRDEVIVSDGLAEGERVVLSNLAAPIDGMLLRVAEEAGR